jgi:hypothetical protein
MTWCLAPFEVHVAQLWRSYWNCAMLWMDSIQGFEAEFYWTGEKLDHDADGIKTGTGWIKPDDGWLVLDRNNDGKIDQLDALFGKLGVWRDLNQDGISQANELSDLADNCISALAA